MSEEKEIRLEKWRGKNNMDRAWEMAPEFLATNTNFDITRAGTLRTRAGFTVTSLTGDYKNLWSNSWIILATKGDDLVRVYTDLSGVSIVRTQVGNSRMSYIEVNDSVVYSNGQVIGYIKGYVDYSFTAPTEQFKRPIIPGHLLEFYNNRIYIANENALFWTDVVSKRWGSIDGRTNARQLASRIRLLKAVDDGLYLSDDTGIYFASGASPEKMVLNKVTNCPAIEGMVREIDGSLLSEPITGTCLAIVGSKGLFIASNGGNIKNVTEKFYDIGEGVYGSMMFRRNNQGMNQLVLSIRR
jgi:hypothetical protein